MQLSKEASYLLLLFITVLLFFFMITNKGFGEGTVPVNTPTVILA